MIKFATHSNCILNMAHEMNSFDTREVEFSPIGFYVTSSININTKR